MKLPSSPNLPIEKLASIFNNTTNSYKYYWFLALLEIIKTNTDRKIAIEDIVLEMMGEVWYPINYFKLSFGKQDQLTNVIVEIQNSFGYPQNIKKRELISDLKKKKHNGSIRNLINELSRYVPYRFLSPWYTDELRGIPDTLKNNLIVKLSEQTFFDENAPSFYRFTDDVIIEINPSWEEYILKHLNILQGFSFWHLMKYLQKNNPNVPNIPDKLFPPETRILTNAKRFWNAYFTEKKNLVCIYSGEVLSSNKFSIDHFLPWSFVAHDQLWNLLPVPENVNSSKGNNLPSEKYLEKFTAIQFEAFHIAIASDAIKEKTLEDYSILFNNSVSGIVQLDKDQFHDTLIKNIKPLMQIAANMGFQTNWYYKK